MAQSDSQVPWTDEQWAKVERTIQEEAQRARVAANFLPLVGPLAGNADYVSDDGLSYVDLPPWAGQPQKISINDTKTIPLATLQVRVYVRGAQMADPELESALQMFRRAANVLGRLEDAAIFNGLVIADDGSTQVRRGVNFQPIYQILGGQKCRGLMPESDEEGKRINVGGDNDGNKLVGAVSDAIGQLEAKGQFGPFAVVLDQKFFKAAQTPNDNSLVLPQDRIIPFLGGGPLVRSSTLTTLKEDDPFKARGLVVALGGSPVELVVATDVSLNFLQVAPDPAFVFRVYEKMVLRIKQPEAIIGLIP